MIIFLYGSDDYRSGEKLQEIIEQYKSVKKSALNLIAVDARQNNFVNFYEELKTTSLFAQTKLLVIKNLFAHKEFQESFLAEIKNIELLKDVIVIYENEAPDARTKLFKTLIKECKSQEFPLLEGTALRSFAQKKFGSQKVNVDALTLLINYTNKEPWRLANEIKKLSDFKMNGVVRRDDVELLVRPNIETDIFKTIDALAARDKKQALAFLQKHLKNGDVPLYILSMITFQFKNLLIVKELALQGLMYNSIVKKSGLHPFVVKKNYFQCSQFSLDQLKLIYQKIFQCDLDIKTGKLEPETALYLLIAQI